MSGEMIFIGREHEREVIHQLLMEKDRSIILIKGRSKIGKTYLFEKILEELASQPHLLSAFYRFHSNLEDPTHPFVATIAELARSADQKDGAVEKAKQLVKALTEEPKKTALRMAGAAYKDAKESILRKVQEYFQYENILLEATAILEEKVQHAGREAELDKLLAEARPAVISSYLGLLENLSSFGDPEDNYVFVFDQMENAPEAALDFLMTVIRELPERCHLLFSLNTEQTRGAEIFESNKSELNAHDAEAIEVEAFGQKEIRALILGRGKVIPPLNILHEAELATGGRPLFLDD